ncbi:MAG: NAD(P)-dependent dehydrogenase (short-subunit alcohol dehydrogenase family) [Candidatus Pseudothioglobus sp.]|jgi:NAD(P)-dependent dehydrogenase (short-subunit alcohol dehydrogenase family)
MEQLAGKVAFVTGGASGLGLAMVRSFSGAGMKVVIADIQDDALAAAAEEFKDANAEVIVMKVDVTDRDAMEQAAIDTLAAFGKIHVVCNNAGVATSGNVADMSYQDWDWVMKVNLDGVINGVVTFADRIRAQGEGGHIINTASMAGMAGMGGMSVYNTSKFAVVGMSEAMRQDLAPYGIGVSVLCPAFVKTNIYTSERNRPNALGGATASGFGQLGDEPAAEVEARRAQIIDSALPVEMFGDMVLHAIQTDEFYILSHTELKDPMGMRAKAIGEAFDTWGAWRKAHNH